MENRIPTLLILALLTIPLLAPALATSADEDTAEALPVDRLTNGSAAQAPLGLADADPWVDANGDVMFGDLDMGTNSIVLNGGLLRSFETGVLEFGGNRVCLEGAPCTSGGIANLIAGTGLTGGGTGTTVTLDADLSTLQARVTNACNAGSSIRAIYADGTIACEPDDDHLTTLHCENSAVLGRTNNAWACTYPIDQDTLGKLTCAPGQVAKALAGASPSWTCADDSDALGQAVCESGAYAQMGTGGWGCSYIVDQDTLAELVCPHDNVVTYGPTGDPSRPFGWVCNDQTLANLQNWCALLDVPHYVDGDWWCMADKDTTYTAGSGISLEGTTIINTGDVNAWDDVTQSTPFGGDVQGTFDALQLSEDVVTAHELDDGSISDSHIAVGAAIAPSKVSGTAAILNPSTLQCFDTFVLCIHPDTNRVGLGGGLTPTERLTVSGSVAVTDRYRFVTPQFGEVHVSALDFEPVWDTAASEAELRKEWSSGASFATGTGLIHVGAAVELPAGATISALRCYGMDGHNAGGRTPEGQARPRPHRQHARAPARTALRRRYQRPDAVADGIVRADLQRVRVLPGRHVPRARLIGGQGVPRVRRRVHDGLRPVVLTALVRRPAPRR